MQHKATGIWWLQIKQMILVIYSVSSLIIAVTVVSQRATTSFSIRENCILSTRTTLYTQMNDVIECLNILEQYMRCHLSMCDN